MGFFWGGGLSTPRVQNFPNKKESACVIVPKHKQEGSVQVVVYGEVQGSGHLWSRHRACAVFSELKDYFVLCVGELDRLHSDLAEVGSREECLEPCEEGGCLISWGENWPGVQPSCVSWAPSQKEEGNTDKLRRVGPQGRSVLTWLDQGSAWEKRRQLYPETISPLSSAWSGQD